MTIQTGETMRHMIRLLLILLLLTGCSYHYTLYIVASPTPQQEVDASKVLPKELPPATTGLEKPMVITPGDFQATQSQGGSMVNVLINLNKLEPTSVSTDAQLQGIPGM